MNRIERMAAILLMLEEQPQTAQSIARRFEVSRRTVLRDVQALSEMGVPVIAREGPGGGYALPADYNPAPLPLTGREAFLLLLALSAIEQLSDLPFRQERTSLLAKLRALLPGGQVPGAERLLEKVGLGIPVRVQRAPFLEDLVRAAAESRWLLATYQSSQRTSTLHLLPEQIYSQDGLWYCQAYTAERAENRTYRVDRFQSTGPPEPGFDPPPIAETLPYDHESHPLVIARLSPRAAAQVEADRHLGQQLVRQPDGSAELAFRCPPSELDYYARLFASLGEAAEVLGPPVLKSRLHELGRYLLERYSE